MRYSRWDTYKQADGGFSAVETEVTNFGGVHVRHNFVPFDTRTEAADFCARMNGDLDP